MNNKDNIVPKNIFQRSFRWDILAVILFILCLGLSIWKLPYGMATPDEGFYLSIPYRLLQGDKLLLHEWHVTQLASLFHVPLLWGWISLNGSAEGAILAFRAIFLLIHGLATVYLYLRMRRLSSPAALCAMLFFFIYSPLNYATLNYNSIGIDLLSISFVTIAMSRGKLWEMVASGICYAGAVLCNPYYFLIYFVYTAAVLAISFLRKNDYACMKIVYRCGSNCGYCCGLDNFDGYRF